MLLLKILPCIAQDELASARASYDSGHYQRALDALVPRESEKHNGDYFMLRADCFHKLGELGEALQNYDKARLHDYDGDDLLLNRGICKTSLGLYDAARFDLNAYMQIYTDDATVYYWMATLEYMCVETRASLRFVNEALYLDTAYADAYYLRGACYADQGKPLLAMEDFRMAFELNPKLQRAKLNLATLLIDMGQFTGAIEMLSELRVENIDFTGEVLYYRAEAFYALHDTDGACTDWKEAAGLGDADALAAYKKVCLDQKGKPRLKHRTYVQF